MKRIFQCFIAVILAVILMACSSVKPAENSGIDTVPEYYGTWEIVKLEDVSGNLDSKTLKTVLENMKESGQGLFTLELGDSNYLLKDDKKISFNIDFDQGTMKGTNTNDELKFEYENNQIIIQDEKNGIKFYLEKVSE